MIDWSFGDMMLSWPDGEIIKMRDKKEFEVNLMTLHHRFLLIVTKPRHMYKYSYVVFKVKW